MTGFLTVEGLRKRFGSYWAIDDISFEIDKGKLLVLLGPSGCGKTTTLRCLGGLEHPDFGRIVIDGQEVTDARAGFSLAPELRGMGMVAQSYAIWPHMSVFENIAFPLRMRKQKTEEIRDRVRWALDVVRLGGMGERNATNLSGGQQQRVALARAIVARPKVLLFDEPLSNLDAKLREQMRFLIKEIQKEIGITAVYVTHDQTEAMGIGDELIVMNAGRIEQRGGARMLYSHPASRFVADFIGVANLLDGIIVDGRSDAEGLLRMRLHGPADAIEMRCRPPAGSMPERAAMLVRPEWIQVFSTSPAERDNVLEGQVRSSQYLGERTEFIVETEVGPVRASADGAIEFADGSRVWLLFDPHKSIAVPDASRHKSAGVTTGEA